MRCLLSVSACAALVGCGTALPIPVVDFEDDASFQQAASRFHALRKFEDFKGAQQALHAYAVLYQDEASKKRLLAQRLGEVSFYSALGGAIAGIARSPEGAFTGAVGSASAGILSDRYRLTLQAANYDLAAEAMRCMDRETIPFSEAGISGLSFTIAGQSVVAESEMRDIAAKNFLLVYDRLQKLQATFTLGNPDLNKLRDVAKAQPDTVSRAPKVLTLAAPAPLTPAQRTANPALAFVTDQQQIAFEKQRALVAEENAKGPQLRERAEDYRARMALCSVSMAG